MRAEAVKVYVAAVAAKVLGATDEQSKAIDEIVDLMLRRLYPDALIAIDKLQHGTADGLKLTPFCFMARGEIRKEQEKWKE